MSGRRKRGKGYLAPLARLALAAAAVAAAVGMAAGTAAGAERDSGGETVMYETAAPATEDSGGGEWAAPELSDYDLTEVEQFLDQLEGHGGEEISFGSLLERLMAGQFSEAAELLVTAAKEAFLGGMADSAGFLGQILVLGVAGAVFAGFAGVFQTGQISETGFFVTYLLVFTLGNRRRIFPGDGPGPGGSGGCAGIYAGPDACLFSGGGVFWRGGDGGGTL